VLERRNVKRRAACVGLCRCLGLARVGATWVSVYREGHRPLRIHTQQLTCPGAATFSLCSCTRPSPQLYVVLVQFLSLSSSPLTCPRHLFAHPPHTTAPPRRPHAHRLLHAVTADPFVVSDLPCPQRCRGIGALASAPAPQSFP